jgi:hypothetical protein
MADDEFSTDDIPVPALPAASAGADTAPLAEQVARRTLQLAEASTSTSIAPALQALARYARGNWPDEAELKAIEEVGGQLAGLDAELRLLQGTHSQAEADRLLHLSEAEQARSHAAEVINALVQERGARADAEAEADRLRAELAALRGGAAAEAGHGPAGAGSVPSQPAGAAPGAPQRHQQPAQDPEQARRLGDDGAEGGDRLGQSSGQPTGRPAGTSL